ASPMTMKSLPRSFIFQRWLEMIAKRHHRFPPKFRASGSSNTYHTLFKLKRTGPEEEVDDAAFVRLQPVELDRLERAEVEAVDVDRIGQGPLELRVLGNGRAHQRRADLLQHLGLRAFDDGAEGEHVLLLRHRLVRSLAV